MRRPLARDDRFVQEGLELAHRVHDPPAWKASSRARSEIPQADNGRDSPIGGSFLVEAFAHDGQSPVAAGPFDPDVAVHRRRSQVDQHAPRPEDAMDLEKGMHHALRLDSSKRPGQHDSVKRSGREIQTTRSSDTELDLSPPAMRQSSARLSYQIRVRLDRNHSGAQPREPPRQSSAAAADL
jgi:hypothetical protein